MDEDRRAVEAAAAYLADEDTGIGFLYSGWCQAALPHRKLADDDEWQIRSDHVNMLVQPGLRTTNIGRAEKIGVPYGSRARLIMIYVQSEALRTRSREVSLGRSMNQWLGRMGIPLGGKSIHSIRDQAERISRCSFTFDGKGARSTGIARMTIFDRAIFTDIDDVPGQGNLFPQVAKLSEQFFQQLTDHPVPLEEAAVRAISNNSMALDLYAWLAYRLHALKGPTPVSWTALKGQFGAGFDAMRNFRTTFLDNLRLALAVYRYAKVEVTNRGVDLYPSRPPVSPKTIVAVRAPYAGKVLGLSRPPADFCRSRAFSSVRRPA
ncbi:MAG: replication protein RepA [Rhodopila sp.]